MANQERAAEIIQEFTGEGELGKNAAQAIAQALANAGLLMPDLPELCTYDEETVWHEGTFQVGVSDKFGTLPITFTDSEPGGVLYTDIETARAYVLKILAACKYAEKENQ